MLKQKPSRTHLPVQPNRNPPAISPHDSTIGSSANSGALWINAQGAFLAHTAPFQNDSQQFVWLTIKGQAARFNGNTALLSAVQQEDFQSQSKRMASSMTIHGSFLAVPLSFF